MVKHENVIYLANVYILFCVIVLGSVCFIIPNEETNKNIFMFR